MKLRELKKEEVEFTLDVEPECCIPVEGNAMCSGDEEADKEYEQQLIARLERGDTSAWCMIIVKAFWNGYEGFDSLGCVTLSEEAGLPEKCEEEVRDTAEQNEMYDQALASLNRQLAEHASKLGPLVIE